MRAVGVRKSPIHGLGLFALRNVSPGERLTHYDGERIGREQAKERDRDGRGAWLCTTDSREEVIDGLRAPIEGRGMASFANHSDRPNARLVRKEGGEVALVSQRPIPKGREVLIHYGSGFWERMRRQQLPKQLVHPMRIDGVRVPTTPSVPSMQAHGAELVAGRCAGAWYRAVVTPSRIRYVDTDSFEIAKRASHRLLARDGSGWAPVTWRAIGHRAGGAVVADVLWDERGDVETGVEFVCEGPCTIEGARHVYVRKGARIAYATPTPDQHVRLAKGTMFAVPRELDASRASTPRVCGAVARTGKSRQLFR